MIQLTNLKAAVQRALRLVTAMKDVREAEVFASTTGHHACRLNYTSEIPCHGVEEPKSSESSGIAIRGDDLFVAGLRGQQLLRMTLGPDLEITRVSAVLERMYGRLRDVVVGPDGALYVATSNRDGRGQPATEDDRILKVAP